MVVGGMLSLQYTISALLMCNLFQAPVLCGSGVCEIYNRASLNGMQSMVVTMEYRFVMEAVIHVGSEGCTLVLRCVKEWNMCEE